MHYLWRPSLKDPNDDMVIELAVSARCDMIVAHKLKDFRDVPEQFGASVLTPKSFLRILEEHLG